MFVYHAVPRCSIVQTNLDSPCRRCSAHGGVDWLGEASVVAGASVDDKHLVDVWIHVAIAKSESHNETRVRIEGFEGFIRARREV